MSEKIKINKEFLGELELLLDTDNKLKIESKIQGLHSADIAEVIEELEAACLP